MSTHKHLRRSQPRLYCICRPPANSHYCTTRHICTSAVQLQYGCYWPNMTLSTAAASSRRTCPMWSSEVQSTSSWPSSGTVAAAWLRPNHPFFYSHVTAQASHPRCDRTRIFKDPFCSTTTGLEALSHPASSGPEPVRFPFALQPQALRPLPHPAVHHLPFSTLGITTTGLEAPVPSRGTSPALQHAWHYNHRP